MFSSAIPVPTLPTMVYGSYNQKKKNIREIMVLGGSREEEEAEEEEHHHQWWRVFLFR